MKLYYDIDQRRFRQSLTDDRETVNFYVKRGDQVFVRILPILDGAAHEFDGLTEMKLAAKPAANDDTPLLLADDFEIDEDGFYVAELTQGTEAIDALLEAATEPLIDIFSELTFTDSTLGKVTSRTGNFRIENDIWKGTEGTPLELPTPEEWLSARAVRYDEAQTLTTEEKAQARENIGAGTGDAGIEVKSANFTAAIDGMYHAVATLTVTDPASPVEGKGFTVLIRNGTATIGGTAYANAGSIVRRVWHSGSYTNYLYRDATAYAAASHTHVSADITDAVDSTGTAHRLLKTDANGNLATLSMTTGAFGTITSTDGINPVFVTVGFVSNLGDTATTFPAAGGEAYTENSPPPTLSHASTHATGGDDAITPADIGAQPAGSYATGSGTADGTNTGDQDLSVLVAKSAYTPAHSILVQQSGTGSPTALSIGTNTLVGRLSGEGSDIDDLSTSDVRTLLSINNVDNTSDATKNAATATLTNKRTPPRVTTITSSATPTVNTDNCDMVTITALAAAVTSMTSGLTGTPSNGEMLLYRIKDNGTARAITWGASFVAMGASLPTTTVLSKVMHVLFVWDSVTSKWGCISTAYEI